MEFFQPFPPESGVGGGAGVGLASKAASELWGRQQETQKLELSGEDRQWRQAREVCEVAPEP